jgi:hypothetical protein
LKYTLFFGEKMAKESGKAKKFIKNEMHKFKEGKLHSGSKKGAVVKSPKQALAISLNSARKKGMKVGKPK